MRNFREYLIQSESSIKDALFKLNELSADAILFVVNERNQLLGSLTDGDVRRGLLKGITIESIVDDIIQPSPKSFRKGDPDINKVIEYRNKNFQIIPVLEDNNVVVNVINFREIKSSLPVDAVIMAGGRGERLKPRTDKIPKPMLKVGDKPILEHNLNRLRLFGIDDIWITLKYLGEQVEDYFKNGFNFNLNIQYLYETIPMGTIGAVSEISNFKHDFILIINSDILTDIDYESFYLDFINNDADLSIVTIPYKVDIPYAVLETNNGHVLGLHEKPTYTYYSNGGIYLLKRESLSQIPQGLHFNTTDLIEKLLQFDKKVISYPMNGYWIDIGREEDYKKANQDIKKNIF